MHTYQMVTGCHAGEFVLQVPTEYDYHMCGTNADAVVKEIKVRLFLVAPMSSKHLHGVGVGVGVG